MLVRVQHLQALSNYLMSTFFSTTEGELNCTIVNLDLKLDLIAGPSYDRKMEVQEIRVSSKIGMVQDIQVNTIIGVVKVS